MPNILTAEQSQELESRIRCSLTLDDLRREPDRFVFLPDLVSMRIFRSYGTARRWVESGKLPEPYHLAAGKAWEGRDVLRAIGACETVREPKARERVSPVRYD
jgi:hypothetical protein